MFTIGADPEVFLRDKKSKKLVSAYGLLPGTKSSPFPVDRGAIQVDGMAAEFNITPVDVDDITNFPIFDVTIQTVINELKNHVPGHSLVIEPVADFGVDYIREQPEEARELGCDPDYNAYTLEQNPRPDGDRGFRTAAGHIHIGWGADIPVDDPEHMKICASFVKYLDLTVGCYMTCIEEPNHRRELYGKAGAFRPKSYGVEYRTPSNVWLRNKACRRSIFVLVQQAINLRKRRPRIEDILNTENLRHAIDTNRKDTARSYLMNNLSWETWRQVEGTLGAS